MKESRIGYSIIVNYKGSESFLGNFFVPYRRAAAAKKRELESAVCKMRVVKVRRTIEEVS